MNVFALATVQMNEVFALATVQMCFFVMKVFALATVQMELVMRVFVGVLARSQPCIFQLFNS